MPEIENRMFKVKGNGMPPALGKKTLGLPRWAWIAVIAGGLVIGLVIRNRTSAEDDAEEEFLDEEVGVSEGLYDETGQAEVVETDAGGVAIIPPSGGGVSYIAPPGPPDAAEPAKPDVNIINIYGNQGCTKPKPSDKPPKGKEWKCVNGEWKLRDKKKDRPGGGGNKKCGRRPSTNPGKGKKWECVNGRWKAVKKGGKGDDKKDRGNFGPQYGGDRPSVTQARAMTGGGPPIRRNGHGKVRRSR